MKKTFFKKHKRKIYKIIWLFLLLLLLIFHHIWANEYNFFTLSGIISILVVFLLGNFSRAIIDLEKMEESNNGKERK